MWIWSAVSEDVVCSAHGKQAAGWWLLVQASLQVYQIVFGSHVTPPVCGRTHIRWDIRLWRHCVFSNESPFTLFHSDCLPLVHHRQKERHINARIHTMNCNHGPSIMIWGATHHGGRSELVGLNGSLKRFWKKFCVCPGQYHAPHSLWHDCFSDTTRYRGHGLASSESRH